MDNIFLLAKEGILILLCLKYSEIPFNFITMSSTLNISSSNLKKFLLCWSIVLNKRSNLIVVLILFILTVVALYSKVSGLVDVSNPTISTFRVSSSMSEDSEHFNPI